MNCKQTVLVYFVARVIELMKVFEQLHIAKRIEPYNDWDDGKFKHLQTYRHFLVDIRNCEEAKLFLKMVCLHSRLYNN